MFILLFTMYYTPKNEVTLSCEMSFPISICKSIYEITPTISITKFILHISKQFSFLYKSSSSITLWEY